MPEFTDTGRRVREVTSGHGGPEEWLVANDIDKADFMNAVDEIASEAFRMMDSEDNDLDELNTLRGALAHAVTVGFHVGRNRVMLEGPR